MKVLVVGAHPDDPETGMGGTIRRYSSRGDSVTVLYLTAGEAGISGIAGEVAAEIRRLEAMEACGLLGATLRFFGQIDGATMLNDSAYASMHSVFREESPDVVFTHWPVDSHRDHRVASALTMDAWLAVCGEDVPLYYYEVLRGVQTFCWQPTDWVDITAEVEVKRAASFAHASQRISATYDDDHGVMDRIRGLECGSKFGEGFLRHQPGATGRLPQ